MLAVGTLEPRKNLPRLAEATRRLGVELRVVGAARLGRRRASAATASAGSGVVPTRSSRALYRGALCVAYPSLYEGFGIPVLEAMRCGAPVVTSAGTAMEEVAGRRGRARRSARSRARSRTGIGRAIARRTSSARRASSARSASAGAAAPRRPRDVYREVAA